mgnify:CR=1 FL=1
MPCSRTPGAPARISGQWACVDSAGRISKATIASTGNAPQAAARRHETITTAVHAAGGKIALQILHTGRYGYHPLCVAPSRIKSPISPFTPRELTERGIERQIHAFVRCATLAKQAGYDGVEIMGSEGYLINQFLVAATNQGSFDPLLQIGFQSPFLRL